MIRLSLSMLLPLTSVAVPADVQTNIRGNVYIPPYTISNGQNIVINFGNVNPRHTDNSCGEIVRTINISCAYKSSPPWIKVTDDTMTGWTNVLTTDIASFGITLYQGKGVSTSLTLGSGSGNDYRVTTGLDTARPTLTFTPVPFYNGNKTLSGGDFWTTVSMSMICNRVIPKRITVITEVTSGEKTVPSFVILLTCIQRVFCVG